MKMKGFSILLALVCIGFVLMLAGNTAHAQTVKLSGETDPAKAIYQANEAVTVTFELVIDGDAKKGADKPLYITFSQVTVTYDGNPISSGDRLTTGPDGEITLQVTTGRDPVGRATGSITARYRQLNRPYHTINFAHERGETVLVVLPPQETLYEDGLLSDLPDGFDKTWLHPDWVDYCAAGERPVNRMPEPPQPIHLADGPRYAVRNTSAHNAQAYRTSVGNLFTAVIEIRDVDNLSAWQMDIAFNPQILRALRVREGKFLAKEEYPAGSGNYVYDRINPFFLPGLINNDVGVITGIAQARVGRSANDTPPPPDRLTSPSPSGVSTGANMAGILFCIDFQVLEFAEESLGLHNVQLSNSAGARISYWTAVNPVVVTHQFPPEDVNRDRVVGIMDLMAVAGAMPPPDGDGGRNLGRANPINPRADVNDDGIINVLDLIWVSSHANWAKYVNPRDARNANAHGGPTVGPTAPALVGNPAALTPSTIQGWIDIAQVEDDGSAIFDLGIANLERLLQETVPERTKLLLNYPNPFNPETWIPYQLAKATDVSVSIYSVNGALVRTLALGHQAAGVYQSKSQAAYWDGRNELGERVASGVYFYTLTAGDFSATGKMLVRK